MLSPLRLKVGLECRAQWAEIVKAGNTAINLERLSVKELSFEQVFAHFSTVLDGEIINVLERWLFKKRDEKKKACYLHSLLVH